MFVPGTGVNLKILMKNISLVSPTFLINGFLFFISLIILFISCDSSSNENKGLKIIYLEDICVQEEKGEVIILEDFFSKVQVIPLETSDDVLVDKIYKIYLYNDLIYVFENYRIAVFDLKGKYIKIIGRKGQGPGEYPDLRSATACFYRDYIFVNVPTINSILSYDLNSGEFIRSFQSPRRLGQIKKIDDNIFAGYLPNNRGDEPNRIYFFNREGSVVDSIKNNQVIDKINFSIHVGGSEEPFYFCNNSVGFKEALSDTLYVITPDLDLEPYYRIDMGKYTRTQEMIYSNPQEMFSVMKATKSINFYYENSRYVIMRIFGNRFSMILMDKETGELKNVRFQYNEEMSTEFIKEKLYSSYPGSDYLIRDGTPFFMPSYVSEDGKTFIRTEDSAVDEDANPIIVMATIKE